MDSSQAAVGSGSNSNSNSSSIEPAPKPIHSLVIDTGPLVKNDPPATTLRSKAEQLYMLPSVLSEIRDAATRSRVETTLLPFVTVRSPRPDSVKFITGFARRTGDLAVLSRPDIEVLALGYELECERNGGDWRLRNLPGQKTLNGAPPKREQQAEDQAGAAAEATQMLAEESSEQPEETSEAKPEQPKPETQTLEEGVQNLALNAEPETEPSSSSSSQQPEGTASEEPEPEPAPTQESAETPVLVDGEKADETVALDEAAEDEDAGSDSDSDGWITPSNLKKHQARDTSGAATPSGAPQRTLQAAVLTSDYAMQNVALRMNLNLVAPSMARITHLKTWVLRCHGCFTVTKDMARQFCPSCGQPTLLRASCSTDAGGNFRVHLKKNFQWNNRGNVYSVPKPVHGSANGRLAKHAGGQNNWGQNLILAEDQKEYARAADDQRRSRKKDIMDDDYLPGLLGGGRAGSGGGGGGRIRVGAGRNVNSKRKH